MGFSSLGSHLRADFRMWTPKARAPQPRGIQGKAIPASCPKPRNLKWFVPPRCLRNPPKGCPLAKKLEAMRRSTGHSQLAPAHGGALPKACGFANGREAVHPAFQLRDSCVFAETKQKVKRSQIPEDGVGIAMPFCE